MTSDELKRLTLLEFVAHLQRQASAVYVATEETVADDLSAGLREAARRLIDLNREVFLAKPEAPAQGTEK